MSEGLFDETSAAALAEAALEKALATLRRVEAVARIAADAGAAVASSRVAIADLLAEVGIDHVWTGTALQLRLPDGTLGSAIDLQGDVGPVGPAPSFIVASVAEGDDPSFAFHPDPFIANRYLLDVILPRGSKGDQGDAPDIADLDLTNFTLDWLKVTGKPVFFSGAYADLSGKPAIFSGAYADLSGKPALFSGAFADLTGRPMLGAAAGNVPVLDGAGKLLASILPALAISSIQEAASQAAMLALTAEQGDIAIRTDLNKTFALAAEPASTLANWKELRTPTDTVLSVAGLTGTITAAALKTAIAIVAADITDASAAGRGVLTAASYAAITALLSSFAGDTGTGGTKGLVPAPAAGDAAALRFLRANGTWDVPGALPVTGARAISAADTIIASDRGKVLNLAGSFTLSATAAATLGSGFYCHVRKRDGSGVVIFDPNGAETIDALGAISIYQEGFLIWTDGTSWFSQGRPRGWISLATATVSGATLAAVNITAGFGDSEIAKVEFEYDNLILSGTSALRASVMKGGATVVTATYGAMTLQASTTTVQCFTVTAQSSVSISGSGGTAAAPFSGNIRFMDTLIAAGLSQSAKFETFAAAYIASGAFYETTNSLLQGVSLFPAAGTIASISYTVKGYRP